MKLKDIFNRGRLLVLGGVAATTVGLAGMDLTQGGADACEQKQADNRACLAVEKDALLANNLSTAAWGGGLLMFGVGAGAGGLSFRRRR
jgi:hypothetical protein